MPPVGFEHTISAGERPQTYALDRAATRTGVAATYDVKKKCELKERHACKLILGHGT